MAAEDFDPANLNQKPNNSRKQLMLMLAIMVVTLGGSYLLFVVAQDTGVWGTVNKGEFVKPTRSVTDYDWRTVESAAFSAEFPEAFSQSNQASADGSGGASVRSSVKRTWWLLAVANEGCDSACENALAHMRSLQILLTKDATRLRRALVVPKATQTELAAQYPKLVQLTRDSAADTPATGVYIVDPTGVLVLRYPLKDSAVDIKKDLKRLLKYSQLG